jgi:hypothetical protein
MYDLACAASILSLSHNILAVLHANLFEDPCNGENRLARRLIAYWLLTYGFVRISVLNGNRTALLLAGSTYFAEAFAYAHEMQFHRASPIQWVEPRCLWVSGTSFLLGTAALACCV